MGGILNKGLNQVTIDYRAATVNCGDQSGNTKVYVLSRQNRTTPEQTNAKAAYKGPSSARPEAREDQCEANYKVAKEKCEALARKDKDVECKRQKQI